MTIDLRRDALLSRYEGWRTFAEAPTPTAPRRLRPKQLNALSPGEREHYDDLRRTFHASFLVRTPQVSEVHSHLWDLLDANMQGTDRVKGAAVVDAPPALGKSTTVNAFGREFHQQQIRKHGQYLDDGQTMHIPVCRVGFTGNMTTRGLNEMILGFYAHPAAGATRGGHLRNRNLAAAAADCVQRHGTRLLIIDDVHFLKMHTNDGIEVANELKWLANEYPATFLFTGVDLRNTGLLAEGFHGRRTAMAQTARRWTLLTMEPFSTADQTAERTWRALLATIETKLVLSEANDGMLQELTDYLFERSTGMIGSLFELVTRGCARAIRTGEERITRDLLDLIRVDEAAEERRRSIARETEQRRSRPRTRAKIGTG